MGEFSEIRMQALHETLRASFPAADPTDAAA